MIITIIQATISQSISQSTKIASVFCVYLVFVYFWCNYVFCSGDKMIIYVLEHIKNDTVRNITDFSVSNVFNFYSSGKTRLKAKSFAQTILGDIIFHRFLLTKEY